MPAPDRPNRLRTTGLAATTLMATGAYGAGAQPTSGVDADPLRHGMSAASWPYWLGLVGWLVGLAALTITWWRLGATVAATASPTGRTAWARRAGVPHVSLRWMLLTGLLWAAPLLAAPPTASRDVYAYACQGAVWLDGADPYAVGVAQAGCPWSDRLSPLWQNTPTPYGPLAVGLSGGVVAIARLITDSTDAQLLVTIGLFRALALLGGVLVAGCLPRLARAGGVDPVAATWLGLLAPLTMVHAVSGAHNDALLTGLVLAALTLAAGPFAGVRPTSAEPLLTGMARLGGAGVVLGLAVAVKVTATVALPFAVLLGALSHRALSRHAVTHPALTGERTSGGAEDLRDVRPGQRTPGREAMSGPASSRVAMSRVAMSGVAVLGGAVLAFAGLTLVTRLDLAWTGALADTGRLVQWTSLPTGLGMAAGYALRLAGRPEAYDLAVAVARLLGFAALVATMVILLIRAWRAISAPARLARRRLVTGAGLAFAALALLSPVFYPWYALAPLGVLAAGLPDQRRRRRLAGLVLALGFLVLPNGLGLAVLTKLPGALLDVALIVALTVAAIRSRPR